MAKVSTGPRPAPSHSETAGSDSTSRAPPATASPTQPMRGSGPACSVIAATRSSAAARKWAEANSTASDGDASPSASVACATARVAASPGSAVRTRAPPAFTGPGYPATVGGQPRLEVRVMKYMLLFWVDESGEITADEDAAQIVAVKSWVEEMTERGITLSGGSLRSAREAKIARVRDGELLITDGPFAETKEQIGGYVVIECADLDAALRVAAEHPLARTAQVEVRPFWDAPWDH